MSEVKADLKYTKSHEWVRDNNDGTVTIGITDHAQDLMGDMVYVELPEVGAELATGNDCAVIESVKAASDVYAPFDGEVIDVNESLADAPEALNQDPYDTGWIFKVRPADSDALNQLMDAADYEALLAAEG